MGNQWEVPTETAWVAMAWRPVPPSLMTTLGVIEGEALTYLEQHGATPLRRLVRELEWPAAMVMMAVGALVREGLIRATQHDLEVVVEPNRSWIPTALVQDPVPKVWGG